jgi:hypothetical protein
MYTNVCILRYVYSCMYTNVCILMNVISTPLLCLFSDELAKILDVDRSVPCQTKMKIALPAISFFKDDDITAALLWLHPQGPLHPSSRDNCILAVTNERVEAWNELIQASNTNRAVILKSNDVLADIDDPHGYLGICLTDTVLSDLDDPALAPPHILTLKVC